MKKILAFTLAETLIVMGIIGIVSALTLPNLNSSTGEKEKVAKVKKMYQNLNDVYGRATAVYGPIEEWFTAADNTDALKSKRIGERMSEFIKVSKTCALAVNQGCFSKGNVLDVDGTSNYGASADTFADIYKIITADGTSVGFYYYQPTWYYILIDIDGPNKGKSQFALDRFAFSIADFTNYELIPSGLNYSSMSGKFDDTYDHYAWVFYNENMDYLKCTDKLHWQNQTSCK